MKSISKEYLLLFNAVTDTAETLRRLQLQLLEIQQRAEELYLSDTPEDAAPVEPPGADFA